MTQTIEQLQAKVAELEEENARLRFALADTEALELGTSERLAASQAYAEQLREALTTCVCAMQDYQAGIGITEMFDKGERLGRKALSTPISTEALDKYVADKVKDA